MKNKYSIHIVWSNEDDCFVATIPEFPNLSAFGDTREEAITDAQQVLEMAVESLERDGISLPEPKETSFFQKHSGQVRLRMPKSLHNKLASVAEHEGVSLNMHMVSLLSQNNIATTISHDIDSHFEKLLEHQDQHFSILHRNIGQRQSKDDLESSSQHGWTGRSKKQHKQQLIVH